MNKRRSSTKTNAAKKAIFPLRTTKNDKLTKTQVKVKSNKALLKKVVTVTVLEKKINC